MDSEQDRLLGYLSLLFILTNSFFPITEWEIAPARELTV